MRGMALVVALVCVLPCGGDARAQIESGPRVGEPLKGLRVTIAAGDRVGQEVDFVAERKDRATAYLFVQAEHWSRPIARFVRTLDDELAKGIEGADDAAAVAIWLTEDTGAAKQYLPRALQSLQLQKTTLAVFEGTKSGPPDWSVNDQAHLSVVVVRAGKVVASRGFLSVNETDVPDIVKALKKP
jgi:hypothetical protein